MDVITAVLVGGEVNTRCQRPEPTPGAGRPRRFHAKGAIEPKQAQAQAQAHPLKIN